METGMIFAIITVIIGFVIAGVARGVVRWLEKYAETTETKWDDILVEVLHGPVKVVSFVILLHIGFDVFPWPHWLAARPSSTPFSRR